MAKIIRLTEQDLYRIVKRVLNEELIMEGDNPIIDIILQNQTVKKCFSENFDILDVGFDAFKILLNCPSCGALAIEVATDQLSQNKQGVPKIVLSSKNTPPCVDEIVNYYDTRPEEKEKLKTKLQSSMMCIASEILSGGIQLPENLPTQFPTPDGKIPDMGDMIDTATEVLDQWRKSTGGGVQPKYSK